MLLFAFTPAAFPQVATGTPPFGTFSGGPDIVDNANLDVHLSIPVVNKAGRGLPFYYVLGYDSTIWSPQAVNGATSWVPAGGWGWAGINDAMVGFVGYQTSTVQGTCFWNGEDYNWNYIGYTGFVYYDASGTSHYFSLTLGSPVEGAPPPPANCQPAPPTPQESGTATAVDGSGYALSATYGSPPAVTVIDVSGDNIVPPAVAWSATGTSSVPGGTYSITDPNDNEVKAVVSSTTTFTDTLGETALTISGSGTPSSPVTLTYPTTSGSAEVTVDYSAYTVRTNFGCSGVKEFGPTTEDLVSSVSLADGTSYTFNYEETPGYSGDVTGRLAKVTLPTGGAITYAYSGESEGITCADGTAATVTRTTPDGAWTYAHTENGSAWTTTITDPAGDQTVEDFQDIYETEAEYYQGSSTLLETVTTCYNGVTTNCNSTPVGTPITSVTQTNTWASGQESETNTVYNSYGLPTEVDQYGYGSGSHGGLISKTLTSYDTISDIIRDRPGSVTVQNGSGVAAALTS